MDLFYTFIRIQLFNYIKLIQQHIGLLIFVVVSTALQGQKVDVPQI